MRRTPLVLALAVATFAVAGSTAAHATDDPTSHPGPGRRLVCLDGTRELYLTPDEENVPGRAPTPGPCPTPGSTAPPTTSSEIVTLCIQGHTTTGHRGSTNPAGYPYFEGPCDGPASSTSTTVAGRGPAPVKARPRFTG